MKKILITLLIISLISISGCSQKMAPAVVYENFSQDGKVVRNVKVKWNEYYILGASNLNFCGVFSQGHNIDNYSDFFGPIHVEWENAQGKKLTKDLIITKKQLPNFNKRRPGLSSADLYFTQDDVYLYTSDTPNLEQIREELYKKSGLTCKEYRDREFIKKWGKKCLEEGCDEDFKPKIPNQSKSLKH